MKNGIGPQNLGAAGMSSKSKPCGSPLKALPAIAAAIGKKIIAKKVADKVSSAFTKLEDLSGDGIVTQKDVLIGRGVIKKDGSKKG